MLAESRFRTLHRPIAIAATAAILLLAGLPGCKQGDGDRCQVNDDCQSGVCCLRDPRDPTLAGICAVQCETADAGVDTLATDSSAAASDADSGDTADGAANDSGDASSDTTSPDGPAADAPSSDSQSDASDGSVDG